MILIFDLDDTLYPEHTFVESGFQAVSEMLEVNYGWKKHSSMSQMLNILAQQGRGSVFNELLRRKQCFSRKLVNRCLQTYRQHKPRITTFPKAKQFLDTNQDKNIYLLTDGNKNVQSNKINALNIEPFFKKIFITHRYGICHAKPSVYCFKLIRELEECKWSDMVYIGDNPAKDFVNLNPLGMRTIRVLTGEYRTVVAKPGYDAKIHIQGIADLSATLNEAIL